MPGGAVSSLQASGHRWDFELGSEHQPLRSKCYFKCMLSAQVCLTLCNHMSYSPPGSSAHGILQARILDWVAISYSRGSSRPRDQTRVSSCLLHWQKESLPLAQLVRPAHSIPKKVHQCREPTSSRQSPISPDQSPHPIASSFNYLHLKQHKSFFSFQYCPFLTQGPLNVFLKLTPASGRKKKPAESL